ncbi:MAG: hypothetical protein LV468_01205 [Candidatus Nitrosotenuis sp.]|nr:hypothetical protein [Candidatus Nitrosotenuis sp.]
MAYPVIVPENTVLLPPYWFDSNNFDHRSIRQRINDLECLQILLVGEIRYLKSLLEGAETRS